MPDHKLTEIMFIVIRNFTEYISAFKGAIAWNNYESVAVIFGFFKT
jgi:hypothetical protein